MYSDDGLGSVKTGRALFGALLENVDVDAANSEYKERIM